MEYLLKSSGIIAIFYGFYKIVLERETFFQSNRYFLLTGILIALVLPYINIPLYIGNNSKPIEDFIVLENHAIITKDETINWLTIFNKIYLIGVLFLIGKLIVNLISLGNLILKHPVEKVNGFSMVRTHQDISPFSFFNYIVFNPNQFNSKELKQIISHEKIHAFQYHSIDIIISQIISIILWFNPIIWLYKKELVQNLEFIADDKAQQESICKKNYQLLLVKTSVPKNKLALTNNFYNSLIKKRILMLHRNRSKKRNQLKYLLILPLIAVFMLSFNTKIVAQTEQKNEIYEFHKASEETQIALINKHSNDEDFNRIKKEFSKEGAKVKFSGIKRNNKEEITAIKIDMKSKNTNTNYAIESSDPINPIKISFNNEDGNINIENSKDHHAEKLVFISENGDHEVHSLKKESKVVFISEDSVNHITKDGKHKIIKINMDDEDNQDTKNSTIWISKNGNDSTIKKNSNTTVKIINKAEDENKVIVLNSKNRGENVSPLIYIDGKKTTTEEMKELDTEKIESMNVLKGESAIKKYGENGKDGVIEINTKKK